MRTFNFPSCAMAAALTLSTICTSGQNWLQEYVKENPNAKSLNFDDVQQWAEEYFEETEAEINALQHEGIRFEETTNKAYRDYIKFKRWEWYWQNRTTEDGELGTISQTTHRRHTQFKQTAHKTSANTWESIGFTQANGGYWGMGRAECMGFHPTDANTFYVGSNGGGIWKTTNGGQSYTALGDDLPTTQVGNIQVDHANPSTIYITVGPRGGWWNRSMGVYKSTDGGSTWNPTGYASDYADGAVLEDLVMSPSNAALLILATDEGIYRTVDGGNNWFRVMTGSWNDLAWKPGDANTIYATKNDYWGSCEIYKSTDSGANWTQITDMNVEQNSLTIAVTPANPEMIAYSSNAEDKALYVSYNGGQSFEFKSNMEHGMWPIYISPIDQNTMYNGGIHLNRSLNGGSSWDQITMWYYDGVHPEVHADFRNAYWSPVESGISYFCNDGGVYRYNENTNDWTELINGLAITQYYRVSCAQSDNNVVICGSQDNGGSRRRSNATWKNTNGGDAMEQAIDPTDANIMYTTYINGQLYRSMDGWNNDRNNDISSNIPGGKPSGSWVTPYELDPNNPSTIIAGYTEVWKSTNRGESWTQISNNLTGGSEIDAVAIAPSNSNVIYVSEGSTLYMTANGGGNWASYAPLSSGSISRIAVAHDDPNHVWVTQDGWNNGQKAFESTNGGQSWTNVSSGLPNVPTNVIIAENSANHGLYIGNDLGVYYRNDEMSEWENYSIGLPNIVVNDLDIQYSGSKLRAATWGRGVWEIDLYDPGNVIVEDCNGDADGTAEYDGCGICAGGQTGIEPNSLCCQPEGTVTVNKWTGISGNNLSAIDFDSNPSETFELNELTYEFGSGEDNLGAQVKALLCVPTTGSYTFFWASDDEGVIYLSSDQSADNKVAIASVPGWTSYNEFGKYGEQTSSPIQLTGGQQYYFEIQMKEGAGGAHFTASWSGPNFPTRTVINASYLDQTQDCNGTLGGEAYFDDCNECVGGTTGLTPCLLDCHGTPNGTATYDYCGYCTGGQTGIEPNSQCCNLESPIVVERWNNVTGVLISDIDTTATPVLETLDQLDYLYPEGEDNFGIRIRGYLCPPVSGEYSFLWASDDQGQLYLSTDQTRAGKRMLATVAEWTNYHEFDKYESQLSDLIYLEQGEQYYIEVLMKEGSFGGHFSAHWLVPGESEPRAIPSSAITQTYDCAERLMGTAFYDSCGVCAGGQTGLDPVTNENDCIITQINESQNDQLAISLDRASQVLRISFPTSQGEQYKIFAANGDLIATGRAGNFQINTSGWANGIYLVQIYRASDLLLTEKINLLK